MNRPLAFVRAFSTPSIGVLAFLSVLLFARHSDAAPMLGSVREPFDYPAGTLFDTTTNLNGGFGWNATGTGDPNAAGSVWGASLTAGANRSATSPGLEYTAIGYFPASGSKLTLDAAAANVTQNLGRAIGQTIDSGTTYFSLLMSRNTVDTIRTINLAFFNGTTERFAVGQIGTGTGNTGGNIGLLMNNMNPAGIVNSLTPIPMGNSIVHLLIGRIDWNAAGNETVSLWVDPTNVTTEAGAGSIYVSTNAFELTAITAIRPFAGNNATITGFNGNAVSANFDEFRMGGTWESVTSVVPEPSAGLLTMAAIASLGLVRRKPAC